MRVLMLSWEYPPHMVGGLGRHVADLLPAMARRGIEVHLVTQMRRGGELTEAIGPCVVHRVPVPAAAYPDFISEVVAGNQYLADYCSELIASDGPFDLLHNHDWLTSFAAAALKHQHRLALVATIHATERGRGRGRLLGAQALQINDSEWRLTYEAWRVICCTRFMAHEIHDYFGSPYDKLDVVPNGVDPSAFQALDGVDLSAFRARWCWPEEKLVLYVGRVVHEKGVYDLVDSVPRVLERAPEAKFVIAGKGPELAPIVARVKGLNLAHKVVFPGFLPDEDRDKLYKVADCAVFPSLYEPFGIVALEAMAARAPVVVSEVGGLKEVVRHAETGITIYPRNPESCAWGIVHTLRHPEWAQQRVKNAYAEVLSVYNWDTIAAQTIEVYSRVHAERQRADW